MLMQATNNVLLPAAYSVLALRAPEMHGPNVSRAAAGILSDKMPHRVELVKCLLSDSLAPPWQQCSGQQGRYTAGGTLLETFYKTYSPRHFVS